MNIHGVQLNPDFFNLLGNKNGSNYRDVRKIRGKIMVFHYGTEISFGSNYREVRETEVSRKLDK